MAAKECVAKAEHPGQSGSAGGNCARVDSANVILKGRGSSPKERPICWGCPLSRSLPLVMTPRKRNMSGRGSTPSQATSENTRGAGRGRKVADSGVRDPHPARSREAGKIQGSNRVREQRPDGCHVFVADRGRQMVHTRDCSFASAEAMNSFSTITIIRATGRSSASTAACATRRPFWD